MKSLAENSIKGLKTKAEINIRMDKKNNVLLYFILEQRMNPLLLHCGRSSVKININPLTAEAPKTGRYFLCARARFLPPLEGIILSSIVLIVFRKD